MKKPTLIVLVLLAFGFNLKAQQFVSTQPAGRNVIIEEFTGRGCGYCPDGHRIANEIMANNPGRVWAINIHAGSYAQTSYPNMITNDGNTIHNGFTITGYPCGIVNRSSGTTSDRGQWNGLANTQMNQQSECNVAGRVLINQDTRVATITVEVYYTGNSTVDENYLTVAMLQDSILGSQSDYGGYNPTQWIGSQYVHTHILRDIVSSSTWGDAISPTTAGTLITREYSYEIPENIGSPNGVDVDIHNIFFLAWVAERQQGSAVRPILTACKLEQLYGSSEPIYPMISDVVLKPTGGCTQTKTVGVEIMNIGTAPLSSMTVSAEFEGSTQTLNWEGDIAPFEEVELEFVVDAPFGIHPMLVEITEANGTPIERSFVYPLECLEWIDLDVESGETTQLKLTLVQDKWGAQTTWAFTTPDGTVIASGGPYANLPGGGTSPHVENVTVPVDECVLFTIFDSEGDGICCNNGDGYYTIKHNGTVIVNGDGDFGSEAKHLFSIKSVTAVESIEEESVRVYPNPAKDYLMVEGEMTSIEVYNAIGQCVLANTVSGNSTRISLAGFSNGVYFLRVNNNGKVSTRKFAVKL